jgi:hypothetical protein
VPKEPQNTVTVTYREDGRVDRRRLSGVLGATTTILLLLLIIGFSLGAIGAVGVGIGGFVAEFGGVAAESAAVYPAIGQQSECESAPQMMAALQGEADIYDYFEISKGIPVPGTTIDGVSVDITSEVDNNSSISANGLDLHMTALASRQLVLDETEIRENIPNGTSAESYYYADPEDIDAQDIADAQPGFSIDAAGGFGITGGRAIVYQLAFDQVEIGSLGVGVSTYNASNTTFAGSYNCKNIQPPARTADGNFTLPGQGTHNVTQDPTGAGIPRGAEPIDGTPPPDQSSGPPAGGFEGSQPTIPDGNATNAETDMPGDAAQPDAGGTEPTVPDGTNPDTGTDDEPEGEPEITVLNVIPSEGENLDIGDSVLIRFELTNAGNRTRTWSVFLDV